MLARWIRQKGYDEDTAFLLTGDILCWEGLTAEYFYFDLDS